MAEQSRSEPTVVVERSGGGIGLFLLGLAVGAGIALLYAPQSGVETRAELRRGARRARRKARVFAEDVRDSADDLVRSTRTVARDAVREVRDTAREAREKLEQRLARHGASIDEDAEGTGV